MDCVCQARAAVRTTTMINALDWSGVGVSPKVVATPAPANSPVPTAPNGRLQRRGGAPPPDDALATDTQYVNRHTVAQLALQMAQDTRGSACSLSAPAPPPPGTVKGAASLRRRRDDIALRLGDTALPLPAPVADTAGSIPRRPHRHLASNLSGSTTVGPRRRARNRSHDRHALRRSRRYPLPQLRLPTRVIRRQRVPRLW